MVSIIVDDRERMVSPHFAAFTTGERNYNVVNRRLVVGDFVVVYNRSTLIIIERKTWSDLNSTFIDQSRKFNYLKMVDERKRQFEENGVNVRLFYLIEGKQTKLTIKPQTLMTHLTHLLFDYNIHIIYSKNHQHSAEVIVDLTYDLCTSVGFDQLVKLITAKHIEGGASEDKKDESDKVEINDNLITAKEPTQKATYYSMWKSIRGCTDSVILALEESEIMYQFLLLGQYELTKLSNLRRKSGAMVPIKQIKTIIENAKTIETHKKVLMCVSGVSLVRATLILDKFPMQALLYTTTVAEIADLTINNRRLGEALATRILVAIRTTLSTLT